MMKISENYNTAWDCSNVISMLHHDWWMGTSLTTH